MASPSSRSAGLLVVLAVEGCLPTDTRPEPAEVLVTATSDAHLREGIAPTETVDGWAITYERSLISLGHFTAEGDDCVQYSTPDYARILDMQREGPQKINLLHAIGSCVFDFELNGSSLDAPVGEGVTEQDRALMLTLADDPYSREAAPTIHLAGRAEKDGIEKTFTWSYRHSIDYEACGPIVGGRPTETRLEFSEGGRATVDMAVRGGALFQQSLYAAEPLLGFDAFASADDAYGNGDGEVTLGELTRVPLSDIVTADRYADASDPPLVAIEDANEPRPWRTLGDYVYFGLFPLVLRFEGDGICRMDRYVNDRSLD